MPATLQPNEYVLHGGGVSITYVTNGFLGHPTLSYKDAQQALDFKGPEIRVLPTEIGGLVTVTTRMTIDAGSTTFSFLIPVIFLADQKAEQKFKTAGIRTEHDFESAADRGSNQQQLLESHRSVRCGKLLGPG